MADFKTIPVLSLSRWENQKKPGTGYELRVVHSVMDNKSQGCGVEKVYFYADATKFIGKPLQRQDFVTIKNRWPEILSLLTTPPPLPEVEPARDSIEEVPF